MQVLQAAGYGQSGEVVLVGMAVCVRGMVGVVLYSMRM